MPPEVMVPAVVLPPTTPPADHVTAVFVAPFALAENCTVLPATTEAALGVTLRDVVARAQEATLNIRASEISPGVLNLRI